MSEGWVKIHRKIMEKGYYTSSKHVHLWLHLLMLANHKDKEFMWNGRLITVARGQLITGRNSLAEQTGINSSSVERILKLFEIEQQIEQRKSSVSRLITILNYDEYQVSEQPFEQRVNNERTTTEHKQECKNVRNIYPIEGGNENLTFEQKIAGLPDCRVTTKFIPPTLDEVKEFAQQECPGTIDAKDLAERFFLYYKQSDWYYGSSPPKLVRDWKAKFSEWIKREVKIINERGKQLERNSIKGWKQQGATPDELAAIVARRWGQEQNELIQAGQG